MASTACPCYLTRASSPRHLGCLLQGRPTLAMSVTSISFSYFVVSIRLANSDLGFVFLQFSMCMYAVLSCVCVVKFCILGMIHLCGEFVFG